MKRLFWRLSPEMVFCLAIAGAVGCSDPNNSVRAGAPVLTSWSVVDNVTFSPVDLTADGGLVPINGFVYLNALFDRLLDGSAVTTLDGGVDQGTDAIAIDVTPALPANSNFSVSSIYTPNGDNNLYLFYPPGPSLATTAMPTFPSGSTITATMSKTKVRSKKGEPFTGDGDLAAGTLTFQTLPFSVAVGVPMGDADPDAGADAGPPPVSPMMQAVTLAFTNLPSASIQDAITVTVNGAAYTDFTVAPDMNNPTIIDVAPAATWPANATIVVRVDAAAADAVGVAIDAAQSGTFTTSGM
jgi:hypothetical protein